MQQQHHELSLHYASTPTLSTNSVEDNSVNSDDFDLSSTSGGSSSQNYTNKKPSSSSYHSSNVSTSSYSSEVSPYQHSFRSYNAVPSSSSQPFSLYSSGQSHRSKPQMVTATLNKNQLHQIHRPKSLYHLNQDFQLSPVQQPQPQQQKKPESSSPCNDLTVTDGDLRAIDTCYRGYKTRVFVCTALANLYTCPRGAPQDSWHLSYTGIPVLVLDAGATRSRRKRQIQLLLVEKGTCFALWRDVVDNLSQYSCQDEMFHVLRLSTDHQCKVGLSFDSAEAAQKFHSCLAMLTSDPANIALSGPGVNLRKQKKLAEKQEKLQQKLQPKYRRPSKTEISLPCGFQHVVSVNHADRTKYFSLQAYVDSRFNKNSTMSASAGHLQQQQRRQSVDMSGSLTGQMAKLSVFNSCNELSC